LALPLFDCMSLDRVLYVCVSQFPHLKNGVNESIHLLGLLRTLNDTVHMKFS
jgi:hypothetical protein